ncbi:NADPH-dependent F420 reductase [Paludisphaera mucosa]
MKIAIIGAGQVGGTLGRAWAAAGHEIVFGVRDPAGNRVASVVATTAGRARAAGVAEAAAGAEVVVLATPWPATESAVREAGDLSGKVLIDCTNPLADDLSVLLVGRTSSGAELVATWAPEARVVKAFNTTGFENMADPDFHGRPATMLIAGDDEAAKAIACGLARDVGFDPVVAGPLTMARLLEPIALLWINLALFRGHGTRVTFQLDRKA